MIWRSDGLPLFLVYRNVWLDCWQHHKDFPESRCNVNLHNIRTTLTNMQVLTTRQLMRRHQTFQHTDESSTYNIPKPKQQHCQQVAFLHSYSFVVNQPTYLWLLEVRSVPKGELLGTAATGRHSYHPCKSVKLWINIASIIHYKFFQITPAKYCISNIHIRKPITKYNWTTTIPMNNKMVSLKM